MILDDILARTRAELPARRAAKPLEALAEEVRSLPPVHSLAAALRRAGEITCIAEFKRRSPSRGWIREGAVVSEIVPRYAAAGAAALSVLTDEPFFGGRLADLQAARALVSIPILRKDFIVDPYQIVEARAAGADAVLLIVAALDDATLGSLFAAAGRWGVETLVEAHDASEVERAVKLGATVIGVNHRDLRTFEMVSDLAVKLRPHVPADRILVAESGIHTHADVARLREGGIEAMLVGESLMRAADPGAALAALRGP